MSTESFTRVPAQQNASAAPIPLDGHVAEVLDKANRRSQTYGVAVHDEPDYSSPSRGHMSSAMDENRFLFQHAAPIMETLYGQIANTHSMVLLTSAQGMVLHSLGDNDFLEKANQVALVPGMDWSEKTKGTNAIGTALSEEEAITVHVVALANLPDWLAVQRQRGCVIDCRLVVGLGLV